MALMKAAAYCGCVFAALAASAPAAATALPAGSWNGYHWARTGPLAIMIGDNVSASWDSYLGNAATMWSADKHIDFVQTAGMTTASACSPVYGTVQACSANYGATGWLGYATVWTSGNYIIEATVKLNDYYFSQAKYNTVAFRTQVACQEVGHTLGLAHADVNYSNANLGTCMDYSNDPTGKLGTNGTLSDLTASATDFQHLDGIYAVLDSTQLPFTKPQYKTSDAMGLPGDDDIDSAPVALAAPEPSSWAMMLVGFGALGMSLRSRRTRVAFAPAL
jgi:hypothetical protein